MTARGRVVGDHLKGYTGKDGQFIDHYNSSRKDRNREGLEKYEGGGWRE